MSTQIKLRRDTAANWAGANPVLALGEPGYDTNSKKLKIGDGVTAWNSLQWATATNYNDLTNKPTLPTDLSDLTDNNNLLNSGGLSVSDFGDGFSQNNAGKIVTNKLYSTNGTNSNQHYRLTLDTNGVVVLPDQSIINGATLRVVPGTGELNYAALAAGPSIQQPEKTWVWVDANGASIETDSYGAGHTWHFDNNGDLVLPAGGDIKDSEGNTILNGIAFNQSLNTGDEVQFRSAIVEGAIIAGSDPYAYEIRVTNPEAVVTFTRPNNSPNVTDAIAPGLTIKRLNGGAIFNVAQETSYTNDSSPAGTEWNADGWDDLTDIHARTYTSFEEACDNAIGENVTHKYFVMHDTINDQYWAIKFEWWQPGGGVGGGSLPLDARGGFGYTRYPIDTTNGFVRVVRPYNDDTVVDEIDTGLTIARASQYGIYNSAVEEQWDPDVSPSGTLWNDEGWGDLTEVSSRNFYPLYTAVHGQLGNHLVGRELVMWDTANNKYYTVKFSDWGQNNGGSFAYVRRELLTINHQIGLKFSDNTVQKTAYVPYKNISIDDRTGTISVKDGNDLILETTADYGVNADIIISSSQDLWMYAGGEAQLIGNNSVAITTGDSEFYDWYNQGSWDGQTFVIYAAPWYYEYKLFEQYINGTYNIQFRNQDTGAWINTYSTGPATFDSNTNLWTIPVDANNDTGSIIYTSIVRIRDLNYQGNSNWNFNRDGTLELPLNSRAAIRQHNSFTSTHEGYVSDPGGIIWTSREDWITSVKMNIQIEVQEAGGDGYWHTQMCEAIIAKRATNTGDPVMTVYGVTHTSINPLATFTVQRNATTNLIEVVGTRTDTAGTDGLQYRIHSVELGTRD